ncbi:hypothetical protein GLOIN_2v1707898 [Rhizophagus clarus]|uniref:Uncharacterized protein n=1 Tax=Rhizophagus clarus TaxID=94130 RepID=A0A8H3QJF9_9GLOM|nr:hypothetical protein GLOIN_2v1707898 [Rhizophagus clarus]
MITELEDPEKLESQIQNTLDPHNFTKASKEILQAVIKFEDNGDLTIDGEEKQKEKIKDLFCERWIVNNIRIIYNYNTHNYNTYLSYVSKSIWKMVVDGEKQGLSLQPIFCQLSTQKNVNTHVVVTGQKRGLSKTLLTKLLNEQNSSFEVFIYDLDIKTNNGIGTLDLVFQGINHFVNQIQPDVLLYIKNQDNYAMRGVESALHLNFWNTIKVNIQVITQDRPDSLDRLIRSLKSSYYFGDEIGLTINIDRGADPVTKEYCHTLEWPFGQRDLRHRIVQGGLMAAVVESYYPNDDNDYAVLLEDDVELSPYYYAWAK